MTVRNALPIINTVLLLALAAYIFFKPTPSGKNAYVMNQRVFSEFKGKIELETKLNQVREQHKKNLDSLGATAPLKQQDAFYQDQAQQFAMQEQALSERYTADIWKRINESVAEYGKKKGYDFIFGASGDGSIMFAGEANDVTDDVIRYINQSYNEN
jgi:outer membrane protein